MRETARLAKAKAVARAAAKCREVAVRAPAGNQLQRPGPIQSGASFEDAVASQIQLQIPLVLVQLDKADNKGGSCLTYMPRVVPIYTEKTRFTLNGVDYEREMLPLKLSLADTIHSAQGTSADEHVMVPPYGQHPPTKIAYMHIAPRMPRKQKYHTAHNANKIHARSAS